ncbi:MAG TPA: SDR family NAD(P)-dependent oxidoreductase [Chloroflexota bacterium]|jgi:NAD(P)-dependent dehydrogenase (short-subunit alcohol dehydrogenase family)
MSDLFVAASEAVQTELSVEGKSVLITGGGAGLGRAGAALLAWRGARVTVADVRPDRVEEAAAAIPGAVGVVADVADPEVINGRFVTTVPHVGSL